jgi:hypothetical protein
MSRVDSRGLLALAATLALSVSAAAQSPKVNDLPARDTVVPMTLDAKDEAALRERVMAWWNARVKRDHQAMYDLFEPAYRAKVAYAEFTPESTTRSRFDITAPEVKEIVAESPTSAKVKVQFQGMVSIIGKSFPSTTDEKWVKVDGKWFKVHEATINSILTPPSPK